MRQFLRVKNSNSVDQNISLDAPEYNGANSTINLLYVEEFNSGSNLDLPNHML